MTLRSLSVHCILQDSLGNSACYYLFCTTTPLEKSLPPNQDALYQLLKRANYQATIWRSCLEPTMPIPSPTDHGWIQEGELLEVKWLNGSPAPLEVLSQRMLHGKVLMTQNRTSVHWILLVCFMQQLGKWGWIGCWQWPWFRRSLRGTNLSPICWTTFQQFVFITELQ